MMRIAVCDPQKTYRIALIEMIKRWNKKNAAMSIKVASYKSSEDLLWHLESKRIFDVIFLAVSFPNEMNGLDLAQTIRSFDECTQIIFMADSNEFACEGYHVNALRYLCKPIFPNQLFECLDIAYKQWRILLADKVILGYNRGTLLLCKRNILYIESQGHTLLIRRISDDQPLLVHLSLTQMMKHLSCKDFVMCHRSFIVNLTYISSITYQSITLTNDQELPIGKKYHTILNEALKLYCLKTPMPES